MKKALLIVLAMIFSFGAAANYECYRKVLNDFSSDSAAFQVKSVEAVELFESDPEKAASFGVSQLEGILGCEKNSFALSEVSCKEVVPGNAFSKVCYLESQHGYFFVSIDMMEGLNVVFNRWD